MSTILARVVEKKKPKRERLYVAIAKGDGEWFCGNPRADERAARHNLGTTCSLEATDVAIIPGSDEELTPELIEAAIEEILSGFTAREGIAVGPALRMLVRRLGLESEGAK